MKKIAWLLPLVAGLGLSGCATTNCFDKDPTGAACSASQPNCFGTVDAYGVMQMTCN